VTEHAPDQMPNRSWKTRILSNNALPLDDLASIIAKSARLRRNQRSALGGQ